MSADGLRDILDFVGWFVVEGKEGNFMCPEDVKCKSDTTMLCVRNMVGDTDYTWWDFQHCMMSHQMKEPGNAEACAKQLNLDFSKISSCVSGSTGQTLLAKSASVMNAANPPVKYAPDVRIAGKQFKGQNYLKAVCDLYTGDKPKGCSEEAIRAIDTRLGLTPTST
eukprot:g6035.t1